MAKRSAKRKLLANRLRTKIRNAAMLSRDGYAITDGLVLGNYFGKEDGTIAYVGTYSSHVLADYQRPEDLGTVDLKELVKKIWFPLTKASPLELLARAAL